MIARKEGAMDDVCLKCAMGKCEHVMTQTFIQRDSGQYWKSYYCALTGWELTDKPSSISRESCSRYIPEIKYPKEG